MAGIGGLYFELAVNTGRFETDMGRAAKATERRAKEIQAKFDRMGAQIGKTIALIGGPAGLGLMIKNSIDAAAELDDMSQKTGVAVEALSRLQYAAGREGIEDLGGSLAKLAKTIESDAELFDALGVKATDAAGKLRSVEDVFMDLADVFAKSPDGVRKTALAMEIFGKSGAAMIPLLNQGRAGLQAMGEASDRFGYTIGEKAAKAADDFNNKMFALSAIAKGASNQMTAELLPTLNRIADAMTSNAGGTSAFTIAGKALSTVLETVTVLGANVAYVFEQIATEVQGMGAQLVALAKLDFEGFAFIRKTMVEDAELARKRIDELSESILGLRETAAEPTEGPKAWGTLPDVDAITKAKKDAERAAKVAKKATDEWATSLESAANIQREVERLGEKSLAIEEERKRIFEETRTPAERYAAAIEHLNKLFDNGSRDSQTYNRAVAQAQAEFDAATQSVRRLEKATEDSTDNMSKYAERARENMQDSMAQFFMSFDQGAKGMVRSFAQALQEMAAQAAAAEFLKILIGDGKQGSSFGDSLLGSAFSAAVGFFSGGGMSSSGTVTRATGGPVMAGMPYLVGERGPELMVPSTAGKIVPNHAMGGGGVNLRVVNAYDQSVMGDYMSSSEGEQVFLNLIDRNGSRIRNLVANG